MEKYNIILISKITDVIETIEAKNKKQAKKIAYKMLSRDQNEPNVPGRCEIKVKKVRHSKKSFIHKLLKVITSYSNENLKGGEYENEH